MPSKRLLSNSSDTINRRLFKEASIAACLGPIWKALFLRRMESKRYVVTAGDVDLYFSALNCTSRQHAANGAVLNGLVCLGSKLIYADGCLARDRRNEQ